MATNAAPYLGEIRKIRDIGRPQWEKYIWTACLKCGKQRWVQYLVREAKPRKSLCRSCCNRLKGEAHPSWKGGRPKTGVGYICIKLSPDDFFYPMANKRGYVLEHRIVMAKQLGRCLQRWELVHHKNGIKDDNLWENLQLISDDRHKQITILENRIKLLETRVTILEAENTLLKIQTAESDRL